VYIYIFEKSENEGKLFAKRLKPIWPLGHTSNGLVGGAKPFSITKRGELATQRLT
jgi:hypothetical protein